jgi:hypothetical protein
LRRTVPRRWLPSHSAAPPLEPCDGQYRLRSPAQSAAGAVDRLRRRVPSADAFRVAARQRLEVVGGGLPGMRAPLTLVAATPILGHIEEAVPVQQKEHWKNDGQPQIELPSAFLQVPLSFQSSGCAERVRASHVTARRTHALFPEPWSWRAVRPHGRTPEPIQAPPRLAGCGVHIQPSRIPPAWPADLSRFGLSENPGGCV